MRFHTVEEFCKLFSVLANEPELFIKSMLCWYTPILASTLTLACAFRTVYVFEYRIKYLGWKFAPTHVKKE
jgi:hypothetical protein